MALRFPTWVFDAPRLALIDGLIVVLPLEDQVETGISEIGMSPSNPRMEEIKLSNAYI
jgi:hypothetical protein